MASTSEVHFTQYMVLKVMREMGLNWHMARHSTFLNKAHRTQRVDDAQKYLKQDWGQTAFTDETTLTNMPSKSTRVWCKPNEAWLERDVKPKFTSKRLSIIVWAGISKHGQHPL
ncbi:hypothetical protein CBOM_02428 [Ceraceosorus bombacis]|uniref:Uncharacterized protein n=1 Tax=Ceraceosorus bombacis TaxID=401625 RepID=A0A0P1BEN3_9BASI|nr:hypothetical protein CBOM_02428 [Ceraceosorus bombacis]